MIDKVYVDKAIKRLERHGALVPVNGHYEMKMRPLKTMYYFINSDNEQTRQCDYWTSVFTLLSLEKDDPNGFTPSVCQECWKVVVRPRDLEELYVLLYIEIGLNLHSKCGIDVRDDIPYNYGGAFYATRIDDALDIYNTVRKKVDDMIGNIPVIVKRGCTAYEQGHGDSKYWKLTEEQRELEDYITNRIRAVITSRPNDDGLFRIWEDYIPRDKGCPEINCRTYHESVCR